MTVVYAVSHGSFPQTSSFLRNLSQSFSVVFYQNWALYHSQLKLWKEGYIWVTPVLVYLSGSGSIPKHWKTAKCVIKLLPCCLAQFGKGQLALPR